MKINIPFMAKKENQAKSISILVASSSPSPEVLEILTRQDRIALREAFTTQGVLQELPGVNLVICETVLEVADISSDLLNRSLEMSGVPIVKPEIFLKEPEEWISRARLSNASQISFLPSRQVNLVNWSGGVGKTTLAMAICKRFAQRTGLPVALLELSMGGSALQARISPELPEFYAIATGKEKPETWQGVDLYPMDGRSIDVLWSEDPHKVRSILDEIRKKHTLFVVDCFPGHPLFPELESERDGVVNLIVTSPRDDAVMQAKRLLKEVSGPVHLIMNMTRGLADQAGACVTTVLPYKEGWAQRLDPRLADPLLALIYNGWNGRKA